MKWTGMQICIASLAALMISVGAVFIGSGTPPVHAARLFRCNDAAGRVSYSALPCADSRPRPMAIDRADTVALTGAGDVGVPEATPNAATRGPAETAHRLTADERRRIAVLRNAEATMTEQARVATDIEIAAIREGVQDAIPPAERTMLDALRRDLAAAEGTTRDRALREWQRVYARYRTKAQPRRQLSPGGLAGPLQREPTAVPRYPDAPLGSVVPGTRGPLVPPPGAIAAPPLPLPRPGPIADPLTGQILAPAGDHLVDPLTGTLWMRSGRSYVDPATGRIIPAN